MMNHPDSCMSSQLELIYLQYASSSVTPVQGLPTSFTQTSVSRGSIREAVCRTEGSLAALMSPSGCGWLGVLDC